MRARRGAEKAEAKAKAEVFLTTLAAPKPQFVRPGSIAGTAVTSALQATTGFSPAAPQTLDPFCDQEELATALAARTGGVGGAPPGAAPPSATAPDAAVPVGSSHALGSLGSLGAIPSVQCVQVRTLWTQRRCGHNLGAPLSRTRWPDSQRNSNRGE